MNEDLDTHGVYVTLEDLQRLRFAAKGFSLRPRQPVHSKLAGRNASKLRGRGLMFEEMRDYMPGDDIRNIDWKATARTGKAHVRVYTEERERPVLLVIDQSASMFFGSKTRFKSVVAAELAAMIAWRVLEQGDSVGAVVFDDEGQVEIKPRRSARNVGHILGAVYDYNTRLTAASKADTNQTLVRVLKRVAQLTRHNGLVIVISDFEGAGPETTRPYVTQIRQHNDAIAIGVVDPLEVAMPDAGRLVVSDGGVQMEVNTSSDAIQSEYQARAAVRREALRNTALRFDVPWLEVSTELDPGDQLRAALGSVAAPRRA